MRRTKTNKTTAINPDLSKNPASTTKTRSAYSHRIADNEKAKRREEGDARNSIWNELSIEERIRSLASRPGECRRQVRQLLGRNWSAQEALKSLQSV